MRDAPSFLFIIIKTGSYSLSCDLLKISLIYVFPVSKNSSYKLRGCVVMRDAPSFLFIIIKTGSYSLSCDLLKISLIYVFPVSKNSSYKLIKQSNQPVHTFFCQFCTHLFYIEGNG